MVQELTQVDRPSQGGDVSPSAESAASQLARRLAGSQPRRGRFPIPARLNQLEQFFQSAYNFFSEQAKTQIATSNSAEWLLDNFYILEQSIREVREDLPVDYYSRLPQTQNVPRVQLVAMAILQRDVIRLDAEQIQNYVHSFQETTPLRVGELWALPLMLRLVVLEALADALSYITELTWDPAPWPDLLEQLTPAPVPTEADSEIKVVNSILNLRLFATLDWKSFFEATSVLERTLRRDPAQAYSRSDFETRNLYRSVIEELALGSPVSEIEIAAQAIQFAEQASRSREQHVGYYLIAEGRAALEKRIAFRPTLHGRFLRFVRSHPTPLYLGTIFFLALLIFSFTLYYAIQEGGTLAQVVLVTLLAGFPASAIAIDFIHWLTVVVIPPRRLPKLDFSSGVPVEYRTMVVIPALLGTEKDISFLTRQIENHFVSNSDPNLLFALLTDFADAPEKETPQDDELVASAKEIIEQLNQKYGNDTYKPFYLFHRERIWNPGEESWMGWERKRGKLEEFNNLLRGDAETTYKTQYGDLSLLPTIRYVITLDADTLLPRETAQRLIGALAHPLNQAQFEEGTGEITSGYTVLQPRAQVRPAVANQSIFTRAYSGDSVIDLYTRAVSDVYQDLFGEGNYVGKGIYDVDAFRRSLQDKVPENHLLSHDLFEALQGACGLVTDVVLFEDYPPHYLAYTDRLHRWVRGDWQLLPWLWSWVPHRTRGKTRNTFSIIDQWKVFDNLRRSLVAPVSLLLLICALFLLPGSKLAWILFAISPFLMPILTNTISSLRQTTKTQTNPIVTRPVRMAALRALFEIIFLPHESLIYLDAIATTLSRLFITHKNMLQWVTAAHTVQLFGKRLMVKSAWQAMVSTPVLVIGLAVGIGFQDAATLLLSAPLLLGWFFSPYLAARISKPDVYEPVRLTVAQEQKLRLLARATWLYFEHFVSPEDKWLPPDHFQESPRPRVAHQTSPTNIGLMLVSTLGAHDLGYIGAPELALRLRDTFDSLNALERIRGHFLNWYDTRTLAPLLPRYISTVDSGNLAACLLVLKQGCAEIGQSPVVRWQGLVDALNMLAGVLKQANLTTKVQGLIEFIESLTSQAEILEQEAQFSPSVLTKLLQDGDVQLDELLMGAIDESADEIPTETLRTLSTWIHIVHFQLRRMRTDLQVLAPWLLALADMPESIQKADANSELGAAWMELSNVLTLRPRLGDTAAICEKAVSLLETLMDHLNPSDRGAFEWCEVLSYDLKTAQKFSASLLNDFAVLAARAETLFEVMDFRFLYDPNRHVFHIGYNVESGRMDPNYYDLMASEARIASLVAIARGDVPQEHWLYLSRPITEFDGRRALLSWSGTMFEYLMPTLLVESYPNTLMDQSNRVAVEQQIEYASSKGVPWGISESSYYNFDAAQIYQYQAFGVPSLGYKRGLAEDLVIAPYASVLALAYAPQEVMQNLSWFERNRMWGLYGLYESIDFTAERLKIGEHAAVVRSYMAHHQGMILLAVHGYFSNKRMVRRFHTDPRIKSIELLLQEQTPAYAPTEHPRPQAMEIGRVSSSRVALDPWHVSPAAPYPHIHCLSNGKYSLLISASGSGFSRWMDVELTRWRADSTLDDWGSWIYVEDRLTGDLWSVTPQPVMKPADRSEVMFFPHRVEFERQDGEIVLRTVVTIAPEDDVEIRRVTITNHGDEPRVLGLTSYAEIILAEQSADQRHPAFNKLFIESEFLKEEGCLIFHRRPRSGKEQPLYLAHFFVEHHGNIELSGYETDRKLFLGRGGTDRAPVVFSAGNEASLLARTTGATLDPVCTLQAEIALKPYETTQIVFATAVAASRKDVLQLVYRYRRWTQISRAIDEARVHAEQEIAQLEITSRDIERFQKLLSPLLYTSPALRADPHILAANTLGQPGLWAFAISGDYPILLLRLRDDEHIDLLSDIMLAYTYWRRRGLMIDVVILNQLATGYDQELSNKILRVLNRTGSNVYINKRGGIFILHEDQMNEAERILLQSVARVILDGELGSLERQLSRLDVDPVRLPRFVPIEQPVVESTDPIPRPTDLLFDNGFGGFSPDGREYVLYLNPNQWTPAPWVNVIATPEMGCVVSESGLGYTWAQNSGENRLTPWRNDAVSDPPSEAIYLRDEDTGEVWSPMPLPTRADAAYLVRHGAGYSIFQHASHGLEQTVRVFVAANDSVKIIQLKLRNVSQRTRRINTNYFAEWVLGTTHENTAPYIVPEFASHLFALLARNTYNQDFSQRVAFLASTREPQGVTADRAEFLGSHGSYTVPAALERVGLAPRLQAGVDPCAAMQVLLWLQPGETKEVTFLLGQGTDRADSERIIAHYRNIQNVEAAWDEINMFWDAILGQTHVETPDKAMDLLLNRWLLYQSLSARFWGRTGFYQSSGAYGFRDQLQDAMAYVHVKPQLLREHLLESARYQFEEGDVLHWWHPPAGRGIRTHCSDDLLWMPFAAAHYVQSTGDRSILYEEIPFLSAEPLKKGEHERYGQFPSGSSATFYEHCCRAIAKGTTAGIHGIPLMGAHDWNDGMNLVGAKGTGESIWLGWFLSTTLMDFAHICEIMEDGGRAEEYRKQAAKVNKAIETAGWDGEWYRRAYYDDGFPLGSKQNDDCKIDSLAQSWSIISEGGDAHRALQAMESVYRELVNPQDELIQLLKPPFDKTPRNPGYIKGYPPGIRENGGQYTHAALWVIWAFADLGQGDRAHELFRLINPILHVENMDAANRYRVEPYVIAADVYSTPPHNGRGGWTWYTGSASWMYRLGVERLLGMNRFADHLEIRPCIPADWKQYQINYLVGKTMYHIRVENPNGANSKVSEVLMDEAKLPDLKIPLAEDERVHEIVVLMK